MRAAFNRRRLESSLPPAAQQAHEGGARIGMVVAITLIGAGLAIASWLAWRWWVRRRQEAPALPQEEKKYGLE
jgi:hypothetical protein